MRIYVFCFETKEGWERYGRYVRVKANTLRGAFKKAFKKKRSDEDTYEVLTRRSGCKLLQPCWDFFNGEYSY